MSIHLSECPFIRVLYFIWWLSGTRQMISIWADYPLKRYPLREVWVYQKCIWISFGLVLWLMSTDCWLEFFYEKCSEFGVTVGTATRTADILIQSRLNALVVNSNRPSGPLRLYAGLIGSVNPRWLKADLVACANPSSSSWMWVDECFFRYRCPLTWVVSAKGPLNGCV